jgi:oxygen-independent coproporphyrinogen-3 oxidase
MTSLTASGASGSGIARLPRHLYVHVPFCASRCDYCDFYSSTDFSGGAVDRTFAAIRDSISGWGGLGLPGAVDTVYFGGGTPSVVARHVADALDHIRATLPLAATAEITAEANPDSLNSDIVAVFTDAGFNRLSLGVQSFDDCVLQVLGRRHDGAAARVALRRAVASGMRVSVDLICGVPGQDARSWRSSVLLAAASGADHVSVYPLSIESTTPMGACMAAGALEAPDADRAADMMLDAERLLGEHGFDRYEVANYAAGAQARSRHNLAYWTGVSYLGIGPGAHGMLDPATAAAAGLVGADCEFGRVRYANREPGLDSSGCTQPGIELLTLAEAAREDVMLGLRLVDGVSDDLVGAAGVSQVLENLAEDGLVEHVNGAWRTTERGWLLGNEVFARVWDPS